MKTPLILDSCSWINSGLQSLFSRESLSLESCQWLLKTAISSAVYSSYCFCSEEIFDAVEAKVLVQSASPLKAAILMELCSSRGQLAYTGRQDTTLVRRRCSTCSQACVTDEETAQRGFYRSRFCPKKCILEHS